MLTKDKTKEKRQKTKTKEKRQKIKKKHSFFCKFENDALI